MAAVVATKPVEAATKLPTVKTPGVNSLSVLHARMSSPIESLRATIKEWPEYMQLVYLMGKSLNKGATPSSILWLIEWLQSDVGLNENEARHWPISEIVKVIDEHRKTAKA